MRSGTRRQSFTDRLFGTKEEREALKLEKEARRMKEQQEEDVSGFFLDSASFCFVAHFGEWFADLRQSTLRFVCKSTR